MYCQGFSFYYYFSQRWRVNKCKKRTAQEDKPRVYTLKIVFKSNATELEQVNMYRSVEILMEITQLKEVLKQVNLSKSTGIHGT